MSKQAGNVVDKALERIWGPDGPTGPRTSYPPLAILDELRSPRFRKQLVEPYQTDDARLDDFVRDSLHKAIMAAEAALNQDRLAAEYDRFASFRDAADRASKAIADLRQWLGSSEREIVFRLLSLGEPSVEHNAATATAQFEAGQLEEVQALLESISQRAEAHRALWAKNRLNPGHPDKAAFHESMVRLWKRLTGKWPSKSISDTSPFLVMTGKGWQDWKGEDAVKDGVSFVSAHRGYFASRRRR